MNSNIVENIESAELVLPCSDLDETFRFFTEDLDFKVISIFPADNPSVAVILGYGLRIRLEKTDRKISQNENITINLNCESPLMDTGGKTEFNRPNGVTIKLVDADPPIYLPKFESKFVHNKFNLEADWIKGRADMRYRDLIPGRMGGLFIASHIHIAKGGVVPDYVHFHKIHFQMIYCRKGWAKLVYEDQGEPFIFRAGDCVLQPPEIRHRVLESSDNLEVIEVSSPAKHETFAEHKITLPNENFNPKRDFSGQKFVHHRIEKAVWENWRIDGFECRDTGIGVATDGLGNVKIVRPNSAPQSDFSRHENKFCFIFILNGRTDFQRRDEKSDLLNSGDSLVIPTNLKYGFSNCSDDLEMLEVML